MNGYSNILLVCYVGKRIWTYNIHITQISMSLPPITGWYIVAILVLVSFRCLGTRTTNHVCNHQKRNVENGQVSMQGYGLYIIFNLHYYYYYYLRNVCCTFSCHHLIYPVNIERKPLILPSRRSEDMIK